MKIIQQMNSGEIITLKAIYHIAGGKFKKEIKNLAKPTNYLNNWLGNVALQAGYAQKHYESVI